MNPDRLAELERQRELVRAHLAWLDREIAATRPPPPEVAPAGASPSTPHAPQPVAGLAPAPVFATALATDAAVAGYEPDAQSAARSVRRGCLLLSVAGLLLFIAALSVVFFLRYRDRPLIFMETEPATSEKLPTPPPAQTPRK